MKVNPRKPFDPVCRQARAQNIKRVKPGEILITQSDKNFGRLHGQAATLVQQLKNVLGLKNPEESTVETVVKTLKDGTKVCFTLRQNYSRLVWAIKEDDLGAVAKVLGSKMDKTILQEVKQDEVMVTKRDKNLSRMHGGAFKISKRLNDLLGDPNEEVKEQIDYQGIVFVRRVKLSSRIWTFQLNDIEEVAKILGIKVDKKILEVLKDDEVKVVGGDVNFSRLHGETIELARRLNAMLGDPMDEVEEIRGKGVEEQTINFTRRYSSSSNTKKVWTFKQIDINDVAKILGVKADETVLEAIKEEEIKISRSEERLSRIHGRTVDLSKELNKILGNPEEAFEETKTVGGVIFTRRNARNKKVWTFKESDIEEVARKVLERKMDRETLEEVKRNEVRVTQFDNNFRRLHGQTSILAQKLNAMLGDPGKEINLEKSLEVITFTRRWNAPQKVWVFDIEKIEAVADILGVKVDEKIIEGVREGEVSVIGNNPRQFARLHGQTSVLAKELNEKLGDPEEVIEESRELHDIRFTRRQSGARKVWTFKEKDFSAVADLLGVKLDEKLLGAVLEDEVRIVAKNDKNFSRIHGYAKDLAEELNSALGDPEEATEEIQRYRGITFIRRQSATNKVWTLKISDLEKMAAEILGKKLDDTLLEEVKKGEVRVTQNDNNFRKIPGTTWKIARFLNEKLGDPEDSIEETRLWEGMVFQRRRNVGQRAWTFPLENLLELEKILIKKGIVNKTNLVSWAEGITQETIEAIPAALLRARLVIFDSKDERKIGLLLKHYGFLLNFETGKNFQARAVGSKHKFDYLVPFSLTEESINIVVEHHPDFLEGKKAQNETRNTLLRLLGRLEDKELAKDLRRYCNSELSKTPGGASARMFFGRIFNPTRDLYDFKRITLIELNNKLDEFCRYVRTRTINDLFELIIWPLHYEIETEMSKAEAQRQFNAIVKIIDREMGEFDQMVLAKLYQETCNP